jgi:hypothetical protein
LKGHRANALGIRGKPDGRALFEPAEAITVMFADGDITTPEGPIRVEEYAVLGRIISAIRAGANF